MMSLPRSLLAAVVLIFSLAFVPVSAIAAESQDSCTGFIDSVPATISTQGVWCLRKNLGTGITGGNAITVATNNVTIDCNDFKLGGLAAGAVSYAKGIHALDRQGVTVRHCNLRGFYRGIWLDGGAGHLVEDNRLDNNLYIGIQVSGDNNVVQRNRVYDTGGADGENTGYGIYATADVIDNTVAGVFATATEKYPDIYLEGIHVFGVGHVARDNRVRGLQLSGPGHVRGIWAEDGGTTIKDNQVIVDDGTQGYGIAGAGVTESVCSDNVVSGFDTAMTACLDNGGNATL